MFATLYSLILLAYFAATHFDLLPSVERTATSALNNVTETGKVSDNTTIVKEQETGFRFSSEKNKTGSKGGNLSWLFSLAILGVWGIITAYVFDLHHEIAGLFRRVIGKGSTKTESSKELNAVKLKEGENKRTPGGKVKMSKDIGFYALFFVIGVLIIAFSIIERSKVMSLGVFIVAAVVILFKVEAKNKKTEVKAK